MPHTPPLRSPGSLPPCASNRQPRTSPPAHLCLTRLRDRLPEKAPMFMVLFMEPAMELPMAIGWLPAAAPAAAAVEGTAMAPLEAAGGGEWWA